MKKVFVILLITCLCVLTGCKPALPGATIYISNDTGLEPESYELDILFDDSRAANPRAFHMKNIGSEIARSQKSIVLENMPPTVYVASVNAYSRDGELIGHGTESFQASDTTDVHVSVREMPSASISKQFEFPIGAVDSITLNIRNTRGDIVSTYTYTDGFDNTTIKVITTAPIRLDKQVISFEWILCKGQNTVAVFHDKLDAPFTGKEKLDPSSLEMRIMETADCTYSSRDFGSITVKVVPDEKLRGTIFGYRFEISSKAGNEGAVERALSSDDLYTLPIKPNDTTMHDVTVIPLLQNNGMTTELRSLHKTMTATPNVKLQSIEFKGIDTGKPQDIELGYTTLEFDMVKTPSNYTKFEEGGFTVEGEGILNYTVDGSHVTVKADKPGNAKLTYKEPVHEVENSIEFNIGLHKPVLQLKTAGSEIRIGWDYIHPDSTVMLHSTITDIKPASRISIGDDVFGNFIKDITESLKDHFYNTSIFKSTHAIYMLEVQYPGMESVFSDPVEYTTGENNYISIIIPEMKDMDIIFQQSMDISGILEKDDEVKFTLDPGRNPSVRKIYWMVNNQVAKETNCTSDMQSDEFVFSATNDNIKLEYGTGIVPQEIVIAVETADGRLYSKNINLNLNMENIIL